MCCDCWLVGFLGVRYRDRLCARFEDGGSVELYEAGNKKLETSSTGITVTGKVTATNYAGDGSALTGVGGDVDITSSLFV